MDSRSFFNFSIKELKKKVPPEVWGKMISQDPLLKIPELEDVCDIADAIPHFHKSLPPHLSRPAILLDERQRAAKRLTLEFMKTEPQLIEERNKQLSEFPVLSSDSYEVQTGVMIVRDPIWLLADDIDIDWFKLRYKVMMEHGKMGNFKLKDFVDEEQSPDYDNERGIRLKKLEKLLDNKEDLSYAPIKDSTHYLEANYEEQDPHNIAYAAGYRVWLLLKEKATQKWVFPTIRMLGTQNFIDARNTIIRDAFVHEVKVHMLGPGAIKVDRIEYPTPEIIKRPRMMAEDIYDLYLRRMRVMFPKAKDEELIKYIAKRHDLHPITDSPEVPIKGKKVFYFRGIYTGGDLRLRERGLYNDWAWVPKMELNKYFDEDTFNRLATAMSKT